MWYLLKFWNRMMYSLKGDFNSSIRNVMFRSFSFFRFGFVNFTKFLKILVFLLNKNMYELCTCVKMEKLKCLFLLFEFYHHTRNLFRLFCCGQTSVPITNSFSWMRRATWTRTMISMLQQNFTMFSVYVKKIGFYHITSISKYWEYSQNNYFGW